MGLGYRFTSSMSTAIIALLCIIQLTSIYGFPSNQVRQDGGAAHSRRKRDATVSFRTRPSNQTAMLGDTVILHCAAHEQNDVSVTWYKGGKELTPPFTRTIFVLFNNDLLVIVNRDSADKYTCELKRGNARISADAWITIHSEMKFVEAPIDATVQFGDSHVFRCSAAGADRITWSKDGQLPSSFIDGERVLQNRGDLVLTSVTLTDTGRYTCEARRDGDGHAIEAKATLVVDVDIDGVCGRPFHATGPDGFITGGTEVEQGAFPWQAMLWDIRPTRNRFFCSGSLINKRWVITAAHCIRELGLTEQDFIVRLGKHTSARGVLEANERSYIVEKIIVHPDFNGDTYESDVALLQLALPEVTFTEYILPICLPEIPEARRLIRPGNIGTVTGWGAQAAGGRTSEKLMKVSLPVVSLRRCRDAHPQYAQEISQNMFCAGRREGGKDACEGDSGGPFAAFDNGRWHLLGVVSWGDGCALRGKYGVYTRLHRFRDWIMEHTEQQGVIDGCASNPCQHGGVCVSQQSGYVCECPAGRKGTHCEQAVQECTSAPCRNGGRCVEGHDLPSWLVLRHQGYFCECREGWEGRNCEQAISACASGPCEHGGQCTDSGDSYSCDCPLGYAGHNCQIAPPEHLDCPDGYEWFQDRCFSLSTAAQSYNGAQSACQTAGGRLALLKDEATSNFVVNQLLKPRFGPGSYNPQIWFGLTDQVQEGNWVWDDGTPLADWSNWYGGQPDDNGKAEDCAGWRPYLRYKWTDYDCTKTGFYVCEVRALRSEELVCPDGYERFQDRCFYLSTGGKSYNNAKLDCHSSGSRLALVKDEVTSNFVVNQLLKPRFGSGSNNPQIWFGLTDRMQEGTWVWGDGTPLADWSDWYPGQPDDNESNQNCAGWRPYLRYKWTDFDCSKNGFYVCEYSRRQNVPIVSDINECGSNPCQNGGNCLDKINGYECSCQPGWEGTNCERSIAVNECWPSPCQNGGRCKDGHNSYTCECKLGWTGQNCETETNECESNPCQNGGNCVDKMNGYVCSCPPQYDGTNSVNVGCASQPCLWGATCFKSGQNGYYCNCRRDFSGKNCEIIDVSSRCSRFPRNMRRECWMRRGALPDPIAGLVN